MPKTVRAGDTVTYRHSATHYTTAEITNVDTQDQVDLAYYHHSNTSARVVVNNAARGTTTPIAVGTWRKEA